MALKDDLQKFREEWRKELSTDPTLTPRKVGEVRVSEVEVEETDGAPKQAAVDVQNNGEGKASSVLASVKSVSKSLQFEDEDSQEPTSSLHDHDGSIGIVVSNHQKTTNHDDSDQYYPFKILTQFLNEAPRKVKPTRKRGQEEPVPKMTYSKKKYFENLTRNENDKKTEHKHASHSNSGVVHVGGEKKAKSENDKRMIDLFIADLDEINEIPFFDSTLPREVAFKIFQCFDMKTLCICAQVSHSWKSLAYDELLWCHLCHKLGFDTNSKVFEDRRWREKVRQHTQQRKALEVNWKARVGKPYQLNFARGGVLCSVDSHDSTIVAGYTSCQVKSWNTQSGDECMFNASNTSLVIDEDAEDLGCIHNEILHLATTANVTAASYRHGFVDIWKNDGDVDPIHSIPFQHRGMSSLCAVDVSKRCSLLAASQQTRIQVIRTEDVTGTKLVDVDMKSPVFKLLWVDGCQDKSNLVVSCQSSVWMKDFDWNSPVIEGVIAQDNLSMVEIHNLYYAPITCIGARQAGQEVGIGFNMITGASSQPKLNVYDLTVRQPKACLIGHTWFISCMDLPSAIPSQLVTGSGDRKVRLFDLRASTTPLMTMIGHSAKVTCIQMDEVKVVSGDEAGFVCVWDVRTGRKLWEIHNRHPVQYCQFDGRLMVLGNIPYNKFPENEKDEFESVSSLRYRGTVQFYDFLANQQTQGVPEICLSSYDQPEAYDYNLTLAVPYDSL